MLQFVYTKKGNQYESRVICPYQSYSVNSPSRWIISVKQQCEINYNAVQQVEHSYFLYVVQ